MPGESLFRRRTRKVAGSGPFLICQRENILYLSGTEAASAMIVLPDRDPVLLVPRMEAERAAAESWVSDVREFQKGRTSLARGERCIFLSAADALLKVIGELGIKSLCFDSMSSKMHSDLSSLSLKTSGLIEQMRTTKSREEIEMIERARAISEEACVEVVSALDRRCTELDLAARIYSAIMSRGGLCAFDPIVAFGKASSMPHSTPRAKPLGSDSVVLIDMGAKLGGYCSDITRTILTRPGPARKCLDCVRWALEEARDGMQPGVPLKEVDARARRSFSARKSRFIHPLGHGLGLCVHEAPTLSPASDDVLRDGMVFTIEPGLYYRGKYGIRWEEDFVCWRGRVRMLG